MRASIGRGFTIIELLVVIAIIVIVVAIVVPALGAAREVARATTTKSLLNDLQGAFGQFMQDHTGDMPGYFSATEMGDAGNNAATGGEGFTSLENAMLDLTGDAQFVASGGIDVGPGRQVMIDPALIGSGDGVYFPPSDANFVKQNSTGQKVAANNFHLEVPDLVDAFGNPILLWASDPAAPERPGDASDFATQDADPDSPARYYWASNSAFLAATSLGKEGNDQTMLSLIGAGKAGLADSLGGLLGSAASPTPVNYTPTDVLPARGRGTFVFHSAGADGVFVSQKDNGAKVLPGAQLRYSSNFFGVGGTRLMDASNSPTTIDQMERFDDVLVSGQ